jgi:hypothetical protein
MSELLNAAKPLGSLMKSKHKYGST